MNKKVILLVLLLIVLAACFIPVTEEKTISVKASFFNSYHILSNPDGWKKWRPDLRNIPAADTGKISIRKDTGSFSIQYPDLALNVKMAGGLFTIDDHSDNKSTGYSYMAEPAKLPNITIITVDKKVSAINYLLHQFNEATFADTHIDDFKTFMETDSLRYGCNIFKTGVPEGNLIVINKTVVSKDKFTEAAKMLANLQQYVKKHSITTKQLIAQFLNKELTDSVQLKVGYFLDKEAVSENDVVFTRMPKGGPLYAAKFTGSFKDRLKVYAGLREYFTDHLYQQAILPFEFYLDNKLPASDTDKVNIQVNFSTYF